MNVFIFLALLLEQSVVGKKELDRSKDDVAGPLPLIASRPDTDSMSDIPDFTPEEWEWLKEQTRGFEVGYRPTRSLIPGL